MGFTMPSARELLVNTIAFGVPSLVFFIMRLLNSGWVLRQFRVEDYLMCVTFCFYISMLTFINLSASYNSNLFPTQDKAAILANPADVQNRILGSKLVIPLEQSMLLSTWGVKTCIWLFLRRLCRQLPKFQFALTCLIIYIWLGYLIIQICYYAVFCRPFSQYWAVPVQDEQCATYAHYSYVQMIFNITSDAFLIAIPLRMFAIVRLPMKRKVVLMAVFSMASFTIMAAILNKAFNFASPMTTLYQLWYIREASVAIWVGNLICCWQLFQRLFKMRSFDDESDEIIAQPEMARCNHENHPSLFSVGGSPKTSTWFVRQREKLRFLGEWSQDYLTKVSRSYASQPSYKDTRTTTSTMTATTYVNSPAVLQTPMAPTTLMTLNHDEDDIRPAIMYRNQEDIF